MNNQQDDEVPAALLEPIGRKGRPRRYTDPNRLPLRDITNELDYGQEIQVNQVSDSDGDLPLCESDTVGDFGDVIGSLQTN